MYDKDSKGISWSAGFFMLICFVFAGAIAAAMLFQSIWTGMTGKPIEEITGSSITASDGNALRIGQVIYSLVSFLLPALISAHIMNRNPLNLLGYNNRFTSKQLALVPLILFSAIFFSGSLAWLNEMVPVTQSMKATFDKMEADYTKQSEAILGLKTTGDYIISVLILGLLPAICEETLFRGGLQNFLSRWTKNPWLSIVVVALIFSAVHFSFYGFLPRAFLGMMLGAIYYYSGSLWVSISAHFLNNLIAITAMYIMKMNGKPPADILGGQDVRWYGILALPVFLGLLIYFKKISPPPVKTSPVDELLNENDTHGI